MEDNLNILGKWKTTSISYANERQNLMFFATGDNFKLLSTQKTTSIFKANGRQPYLFYLTDIPKVTLCHNNVNRNSLSEVLCTFYSDERH
jgi:hypothetical protein